MTPLTLYRRIRRLLASNPPAPTKPIKATAKRTQSKKRQWQGMVHQVRDTAKHGIGTKPADALVEMARDMAGTVLAHPEKYMTRVMGHEAIVVDDATYEALFYLFSGKTREALSCEGKVYAIMLHEFTVISQRMLEEAREAEKGYGNF